MVECADHGTDVRFEEARSDDEETGADVEQTRGRESDDRTSGDH